MNRILNLTRGMTTEEPKIAIPNLRQKLLTQVKPELELLGLRVRCYRLLSNLPKGSIITQNPYPGTKIAFGSTVILIVSDGKIGTPELLEVPGVVGLHYDLATAVLNAKGFHNIRKISDTTYALPTPSVAIVIAQTPHKGMRVDRDTAIRLKIKQND
jgi:eukaryotic-like serine/threonine-protein kinase